MFKLKNVFLYLKNDILRHYETKHLTAFSKFIEKLYYILYGPQTKKFGEPCTIVLNIIQQNKIIK